MAKNIFLTTFTGGLEKYRASQVILSILLAFALTGLLTFAAAGAFNEPLKQTNTTGVTWTIEQVENNRYFYEMTDRSLARYPISGPSYNVYSNTMHYAYGGDHLYYAYFNGTSWATEEVDTNDQVGAFASISVDRDNNPHIAYYDAANGHLKYAVKYFGTWFISTLDTPTFASSLEEEERTSFDPYTSEDSLNATRPWINADFAEDNPRILAPSAVTKSVGQYTSIAIDSQNRPHISYYQYEDVSDSKNNKLKYAYWDGSNWIIQIVQQPGAAGNKREGKYTSIALDAYDCPHIVHLDDDYDDVRHSYKAGDEPNCNSSRWKYENIHDGIYYNVGGWISIAIDAVNKCYVSFYHKDGSRLMYAQLPQCNKNPEDNPAWTVVTVDNSGDTGKYTSLALRSANKPAISYFNDTDDDLMFANYDGSWSKSVVSGTNYHVGKYTSMVFDHLGYPHITFFNMGQGLLQEAYKIKTTNKWQYRTIDQNHDVGQSSSLALDATNTPYISYLDDSVNDLKLAEQIAPLNWATSFITGTMEIGAYSSLAIDSTGKPHVAFYISDKKDLIYGKWNGAAWVFTTVDSAWNVGQYLDLALNSQDAPYISYYDASKKSLNWAYWNIATSTWITDVVHSGTGMDVGKYTSIALDNTPQPNTRVYISYYDGAPNYRVKLAYRNLALGPPGPWRFYNVDDITDVDVGKWTSIALDSALNPHIAYYEATNTFLKYASGAWAGGAWQFTPETVHQVTDFDIGMYASLDMDSLDRPHISYYSYDIKGSKDGDLMYARKVGPIWDITTVDSTGDVGLFTSIAVDSLNFPHISYYNRTKGELMYAYDPIMPNFTEFIFLPQLLANP